MGRRRYGPSRGHWQRVAKAVRVLLHGPRFKRLFARSLRLPDDLSIRLRRNRILATFHAGNLERRPSRLSSLDISCRIMSPSRPLLSIPVDKHTPFELLSAAPIWHFFVDNTIPN